MNSNRAFEMLRQAINRLETCCAVACGEYVQPPARLCRAHSSIPFYSAWRRRRLLAPTVKQPRVAEELKVDGPHVVTTYHFGQKLHRVGGPAVIVADDSGRVVEEEWWFEGRRHRLDGPAVIDYRYSDPIETAAFYFAGKSIRPRALYEKTKKLSGDRIIGEFSITVYAPLLVEGRDCEEILDVLAAGVTSLDGVRAVLDGTPIEWAKSFEAGEVS